MEKNKIKVILIEIFDENNNAWEWHEIVRDTPETDIDKERKETFQEFIDFEADEETQKYIDENWKKNTRVYHLSV